MPIIIIGALEGLFMLKDDFERLLKLFHAGAEGKLLDLAEVFQKLVATEEIKSR